MKGLAITYVLKIAFTLVAWCFPLFFLGAEIRQLLNIEEPKVDFLLMLLGWAYLALCVGYTVGLCQLLKHKHINYAPIFAGIVSNGGAAIFLTIFALEQHQQLASGLYYFLLGSAGGAALVTVNLVYFAVSKK